MPAQAQRHPAMGFATLLSAWLLTAIPVASLLQSPPSYAQPAGSTPPRSERRNAGQLGFSIAALGVGLVSTGVAAYALSIDRNSKNAWRFNLVALYFSAASVASIVLGSVALFARPDTTSRALGWSGVAAGAFGLTLNLIALYRLGAKDSGARSPPDRW